VKPSVAAPGVTHPSGANVCKYRPHVLVLTVYDASATAQCKYRPIKVQARLDCSVQYARYKEQMTAICVLQCQYHRLSVCLSVCLSVSLERCPDASWVADHTHARTHTHTHLASQSHATSIQRHWPIVWPAGPGHGRGLAGARLGWARCSVWSNAMLLSATTCIKCPAARLARSLCVPAVHGIVGQVLYCANLPSLVIFVH